MLHAMLDTPPPWKVFPALRPSELGATQGAEEAWFHTVWQPFWQSLDDAQREAYHAHWHSTADWRDSIEFFCRTMTPQELADDAREADEALARFRQERAQAAPRGPLGTLRAWLQQRKGGR